MPSGPASITPTCTSADTHTSNVNVKSLGNSRKEAVAETYCEIVSHLGPTVKEVGVVPVIVRPQRHRSAAHRLDFDDMTDDVRARLIAATAELVERRGPLGVRVDEIAERAGCSRATLYRYAVDKDELIREVIVARTTVMAGIVAHQVEGITDPTERVAQGMLLFSDALRSESWFKALQNDSDGSYPLARIGGGLEAMGAAISPLIEALLHEYADSRHLREDVDLPDAVEWLMGILMSLLAPAFAARSREHRLAMLKRYAVYPLIKPQHE